MNDGSRVEELIRFKSELRKETMAAQDAFLGRQSRRKLVTMLSESRDCWAGDEIEAAAVNDLNFAIHKELSRRGVAAA